jgi:hypothetical protein
MTVIPPWFVGAYECSTIGSGGGVESLYGRGGVGTVCSGEGEPRRAGGCRFVGAQVFAFQAVIHEWFGVVVGVRLPITQLSALEGGEEGLSVLSKSGSPVVRQGLGEPGGGLVPWAGGEVA